jgi:transposase
MNKFSVEMKEDLIKKVLTKTKGQSVAEIAKLSNVGLSTLSRWVKKAGEESPMVVSKVKTEGSKIYNAGQRLEFLLETAQLTEVELGTYCRKHGLYSFQLTEWKNEFMKTSNEKKDVLARAELKALKAENKCLKQDLNRKDRALAETTALLILKKKADLLFGELGVV